MRALGRGKGGGNGDGTADTGASDEADDFLIAGGIGGREVGAL